jgi:hypothetical protein
MYPILHLFQLFSAKQLLNFNLATQLTIVLLNMASALLETHKPYFPNSSIIPRVKQLLDRTLILLHMPRQRESHF